MEAQLINHQQVADLAMTLPQERLMSAYDFLLFLKSTPAPNSSVPSPDAKVVSTSFAEATPDIFGATEAEIEAEDKRWDDLFARGRNKMRAMAFDALAEIRAGETEPMFDENGEFLLS